MTTNQTILLLDVHRGFNGNRHPGTLGADLTFLVRNGLIETDSSFPYKLTEQGQLVVDRILEVAKWLVP
jgi:hypothetical protein